MMEATPILGALFVALVVLGLVGNGVTIFVFFKSKILRVPQNIFIINLSLCESLFISSFVPFIVKAIRTEWHPTPFGCIAMATIIFVSSMLSIVCMAFLAFSRFIIIVKRSMKKWFQWKYTIPLAISCWVITLIFLIPILTNHARIVFYPNMHGCMLDFSYNPVFTLSMTFGVFLPVNCLIAFFYWKIYREYKRAQAKVRAHMNHDTHRNSTRRHHREEFLLTLQLFIIFILFEVSLTPPSITMVLIDRTATKLSGNLYIILEMLAAVNAVAHPYLYLIFYTTFRAELLRLIKNPNRITEVDHKDTDHSVNACRNSNKNESFDG